MTTVVRHCEQFLLSYSTGRTVAERELLATAKFLVLKQWPHQHFVTAAAAMLEQP